MPELKSAAHKLREAMDKIQEEIDHSFRSLKRFIFVYEISFADRNSVSEELSDLKYGTTDQHVSKELKVQPPAIC